MPVPADEVRGRRRHVQDALRERVANARVGIREGTPGNLMGVAPPLKRGTAVGKPTAECGVVPIWASEMGDLRPFVVGGLSLILLLLRNCVQFKPLR